MSRTLLTLGTLSFVLLLGACERTSTSSATPAPQAEAPRRTAEQAPPPGAMPLNESQSVEALGTINHEEIELARYARERTQTDQARDFAQMMIDQHTEAEADVVTWAQAHAVVGQQNEITPTVMASAAAVRAQLTTMDDAQFDRAYVQSQIDMHEDALAVLDRRILPGATDPDFRILVTNLRTSVATHLAHARATLAELPRASSPVAERMPMP